MLPRSARRHLLAVYAFARLVDDVGDEGGQVSAVRHRQLDAIAEDLDRVYDGVPRLPVMRDVAVTAHACGMPTGPFHRLIEANRQDQTVTRYPRFDDLLDYCVLSANPVGHLVLYIFNAATPERMRLSDQICTALQLAEHWQDVAEDLARDRIYVPTEDLTRFGCTEADLAQPQASARVRDLMGFETVRAGRMLEEGAPLVRSLSGFARVAVAGYVAGGRAALASIGHHGYDVLSSTPRPRPARVLREWLRLWADMRDITAARTRRVQGPARVWSLRTEGERDA